VLWLALFVLAEMAGADVYTVNPEGTGDFPTIQAAVDAAGDGDVIELVDGTFTGPGNRDIEIPARIMTIRSQGGIPQNCVIDCQGDPDDQHRGFSFRTPEIAGTSTLEGVTIVNGYHGLGGAIWCEGTSPLIRNCVFSHNAAFCDPSMAGGAISCDLASPTMIECTFLDNGAVFGGAMICCWGSDPLLERCVFRANSATEGGAIYW